jgi:hypothetical protein
LTTGNISNYSRIHKGCGLASGPGLSIARYSDLWNLDFIHYLEINVNQPIWSKQRLLHLVRPKLQEVFFSKAKSILTAKQWARFSCFYL